MALILFFGFGATVLLVLMAAFASVYFANVIRKWLKSKRAQAAAALKSAAVKVGDKL